MKKIATNKNQLNQTSYFESKRVSNTKANTLLPEKRSPLQSIQNHLHKVQSYKLKTEQANYKNENDSSLDKQIDFNVRKSTELKSGNIAKAKCQNMYKKDVKKIAINLQSIIEKNTTTEGRKQQDFFTILSIQKNESKFKTTSLVSSPKTNKLSQELEEKQVGRNLTKKRPSLKEYMANTRLYQQLNKLTQTNYILCKKIDELTEELNYKNQLLSQKQEQLHAQRDMCQLIQNKCDQIEHVFIDQRNASIQHIEQLTLQNNSLIVVNMKLAAQRQLLLKQMVHCDGDLKRKTEFLQIDIRQYQKRQNIYIQQVQRLKKMIESWSYPTSPQQPHYTKLEQSLEQKQINLQQIGQKGNTQSYSLIQTKFFDSNRIS